VHDLGPLVGVLMDVPVAGFCITMFLFEVEDEEGGLSSSLDSQKFVGGFRLLELLRFLSSTVCPR
jgi:hypothetical protein